MRSLTGSIERGYRHAHVRWTAGACATEMHVHVRRPHGKRQAQRTQDVPVERRMVGRAGHAPAALKDVPGTIQASLLLSQGALPLAPPQRSTSGAESNGRSD